MCVSVRVCVRVCERDCMCVSVCGVSNLVVILIWILASGLLSFR